MDNNTIEPYIIKLLSRIEEKLNDLFINRNEYSEDDYSILFYRLGGQRDILIAILSGHQNKYDEIDWEAVKKEMRNNPQSKLKPLPHEPIIAPPTQPGRYSL